MSTPFEITLLILLTAVVGGIIPVLVKVHRTVRTLDHLLGTAEQQLTRITDDVHAAREIIQQIAGSIQKPIEDISSFTQVVKHTGTKIQDAEMKISNLVQGVSFVTRNPLVMLKLLFSVLRKTRKGKP